MAGEVGVSAITRYGSDDHSEMSSLASVMTNYRGSEISFPSQTPRKREPSPLPTTNYEGSLLGVPPSVQPLDPFSTPSASAGSIAHKDIQSEENSNKYAKEEGGMGQTQKVYTPI